MANSYDVINLSALAVSETANIELKVATGDGLFLRIDKNLAEIAAKGEAAQKSSREAIGILDATTSRKGLVQLSSVTNSSSEALAATPKAVKAAYDLANGKYTAQDATTAQKGIVQLSSAIDSTSETLAATPKAVKVANDNANGRVPSGRKVNGRALSNDIEILPGDVYKLSTGIGDTADLNTFTAPGLYYQPANAQAATGKNYPEPNAGSLEVYKHAGITQVYRVYSNSRHYIRTLYSGTWTAWAWVYDTAHKPSASDVGALPIIGGTVTGGVTVNDYMRTGRSRIMEISSSNTSTLNGIINLWGNVDRPTVMEFKDAAGYHFYSQRNKDGSVSFSFNGVASFGDGITSSGEIISRSANGLRIAYGNFGTFWRNDGSTFYLMLTNSGDPLGSYNSLRPFTVNLTNGDITINKLALANFANFDARYYTKTQSDNGYMAKTGAYTKAESDGRFQPKGNYTPAGQAYTKAESNARYPTGFRIGARTRYNGSDYSGKIPQGAVNICDFTDGDNRINGTMYAYPQYLINGNWYNFS
ncbi:tail fiber protein [Enterobacter ludwigii]|uniref:tail fiber protein n=1 Tax=Enterobacter ludwigii TaxID=299767 RepID=UPI000A5F9AAF